MTQAQQILRHLESGKTVTDLDALNLFRCRRLAARINDLRREGHEIRTEIEKTANGARIARYSLEPSFQLTA